MGREISGAIVSKGAVLYARNDRVCGSPSMSEDFQDKGTFPFGPQLGGNMEAGMGLMGSAHSKGEGIMAKLTNFTLERRG